MEIKYPIKEQEKVVNIIDNLTMFLARTVFWQKTEVLECLRDRIEYIILDQRLDEDQDVSEIQFLQDTIKFVEAQIEESKNYNK